MKFKLFPALALGVMLSACGSEMPEVAEVSVSESAIVPGSARDFCGTGAEAKDRVHYAFDSAELTAEEKSKLDWQAAWLNKYPNVKVNVAGFCDERGTEEYNLGLGERRAQAVVSYLAKTGLVDPSRISHCSMGKNHPLVEGHDEEAYRQNRVGVSVVSGTIDDTSASVHMQQPVTEEETSEATEEMVVSRD